MAGKLIMTVGLVASGKSTWAKEEKAQNPEGTVIVERDEIRTSLFGAKYHDKAPVGKSENQVTAVAHRLIKKGLAEGKTVIVSDTNLNPRFVGQLAKMGREYGAEVGVKHFDTPVEECKRRNRERGKRGGREVPEDVIDKMAERAYDDEGNLKEMLLSQNGAFFVPRVTPGGKKLEAFNRKAEFENPMADGAVVLVDIDGTLANNAHHAAYYLHRPGRKRDFPGFYRSIKEAPVNEAVRDLGNKMREEEGVGLIVLTGRDDSHADELISFVKRSGLKVSRVLAKREGDFRPDKEYKHGIIEELKANGLNPVHALDDRPSSIATMEAHGIMVSRVDTPDIEVGDGAHRPPPPAAEPRVNTIYGSGYCIRCGQPLKDGGNLGPRCRLK